MKPYRRAATLLLLAGLASMLLLDGLALFAHGPDYPDVIGGRGGVVLVIGFLFLFGAGPLLVALWLVTLATRPGLPLVVGRVTVVCALLMTVLAVGPSLYRLNAQLGLFGWLPQFSVSGWTYLLLQLSLLVPPLIAWRWAVRRQEDP